MTIDRRERFPLGSQVRLEDLKRNPYPVLRELQRYEPRGVITTATPLRCYKPPWLVDH